MTPCTPSIHLTAALLTTSLALAQPPSPTLSTPNPPPPAPAAAAPTADELIAQAAAVLDALSAAMDDSAALVGLPDLPAPDSPASPARTLALLDRAAPLFTALDPDARDDALSRSAILRGRALTILAAAQRDPRQRADLAARAVTALRTTEAASTAAEGLRRATLARALALTPPPPPPAANAPPPAPADRSPEEFYLSVLELPVGTDPARTITPRLFAEALAGFALLRAQSQSTELAFAPIKDALTRGPLVRDEGPEPWAMLLFAESMTRHALKLDVPPPAPAAAPSLNADDLDRALTRLDNLLKSPATRARLDQPAAVRRLAAAITASPVPRDSLGPVAAEWLCRDLALRARPLAELTAVATPALRRAWAADPASPRAAALLRLVADALVTLGRPPTAASTDPPTDPARRDQLAAAMPDLIQLAQLEPLGVAPATGPRSTPALLNLLLPLTTPPASPLLAPPGPLPTHFQYRQQLLQLALDRAAKLPTTPPTNPAAKRPAGHPVAPQPTAHPLGNPWRAELVELTLAQHARWNPASDRLVATAPLDPSVFAAASALAVDINPPNPANPSAATAPPAAPTSSPALRALAAAALLLLAEPPDPAAHTDPAARRAALGVIRAWLDAPSSRSEDLRPLVLRRAAATARTLAQPDLAASLLTAELDRLAAEPLTTRGTLALEAAAALRDAGQPDRAFALLRPIVDQLDRADSTARPALFFDAWASMLEILQQQNADGSRTGEIRLRLRLLRAIDDSLGKNAGSPDAAARLNAVEAALPN